jgi:hypothetical protein
MVTIELSIDGSKKKLLEDFVSFVNEKLGIQQEPDVIFQSTREGIKTTAVYNPVNGDIKIFGGGRALVDVMRSYAHEAVHHRQNEEGKIEAVIRKNGGIADIGGTTEGDDIEDEANAIAGQMIKLYAKERSKMIYEGTPGKKILMEEAKKLNIPKLVQFIRNRWIQEGDINLRDLSSMGLDSVSGEYWADLRTQMTATIMDLMENEIQQAYTITVKFQDADIFFDVKNQPKGNPFAFLAILSPGGKVHYDVTPPEWGDFVFNAMDLENLTLLQHKCKVEHISTTYLEHEYPDLCLDICFDYGACQFEKRMQAERLYITKEIMKIFDGCGIKIQDKYFIINAPISFLMTSQYFKHLLSGALEDEILYYIFKGESNKADMGGAADVVDYIFDSHKATNLIYHQFTRKLFKELAGGNLPEFDFEKVLDTSINVDAFNKRVTQTIQQFFK